MSGERSRPPAARADVTCGPGRGTRLGRPRSTRQVGPGRVGRGGRRMSSYRRALRGRLPSPDLVPDRLWPARLLARRRRPRQARKHLSPGVDCAPASLKSAPPRLSRPGGHGIFAGRACKPRALPTGTDRAITVILGELSEHDKRRRGAWGRLPKLDSQPPQCHCAEGQLTAISKRIDSRNRDRRATAVAPVALIPFRRAPP